MDRNFLKQSIRRELDYYMSVHPSIELQQE